MEYQVARVFCLLSTGMLASCLARQPNDLRVNSIERLTTVQAGASPSRPGEGGSSDMLKIDVATSTDLRRLANSYSAQPGFLVLYCGLPIGNGPKSYVKYPDLLKGGMGTIGGFQDSSGIFHYTMFVYISYDGMSWSEGPPYDLSRHPRDICISTRGGNETGFGFKSNDAIASAAQITAALRQH
jgi:hypothetical protein